MIFSKGKLYETKIKIFPMEQKFKERSFKKIEDSNIKNLRRIEV